MVGTIQGAPARWGSELTLRVHTPELWSVPKPCIFNWMNQKGVTALHWPCQDPPAKIYAFSPLYVGIILGLDNCH